VIDFHEIDMQLKFVGFFAYFAKQHFFQVLRAKYQNVQDMDFKIWQSFFNQTKNIFEEKHQQVNYKHSNLLFKIPVIIACTSNLGRKTS
jgi:hypothetical protein